MPAWQKSHRLSMEVFELSKNLPRCEDYGLTSQIRRSSNSVSGNIAEGFGRQTKRDKANFYIISRGSLFETQSHLLYGKAITYFDEDKVKKLIEEYAQLAHELNKLIQSLGTNY